MDAHQLDQLTIPIPCPDCGGKIDRSFEWIKDNKKHWCPTCHVNIDLDAEGTRRAVAGIEHSLKEVQRAVLEFQLSIKD